MRSRPKTRPSARCAPLTCSRRPDTLMLDLLRGDVGEHSLPCDSVRCEGQRSSIGVTGASSSANAEALVTGTRHAPPAPADGSSAESGATALRSRRPPGAVARSDGRCSPLARGFPGNDGSCHDQCDWPLCSARRGPTSREAGWRSARSHGECFGEHPCARRARVKGVHASARPIGGGSSRCLARAATRATIYSASAVRQGARRYLLSFVFRIARVRVQRKKEIPGNYPDVCAVLNDDPDLAVSERNGPTYQLCLRLLSLG